MGRTSVPDALRGAGLKPSNFREVYVAYWLAQHARGQSTVELLWHSGRRDPQTLPKKLLIFLLCFSSLNLSNSIVLYLNTQYHQYPQYPINLTQKNNLKTRIKSQAFNKSINKNSTLFIKNFTFLSVIQFKNN